jgi:hypothetical protein
MDGWKVEQSSKQANHHEGSQRLKVDSDTSTVPKSFNSRCGVVQAGKSLLPSVPGGALV